MTLTGTNQNAQHPKRVNAARRMTINADKPGGSGKIGGNRKQRQPKLHKKSCKKGKSL